MSTVPGSPRGDARDWHDALLRQLLPERQLVLLYNQATRGYVYRDTLKMSLGTLSAILAIVKALDIATGIQSALTGRPPMKAAQPASPSPSLLACCASYSCR